MAAVVLESAFGSQYDDTPTSYQFPERYLKFFAALSRNETVVAVIYEPRGDDGQGRMAYVGVTTISRPPRDTGATTRNGERLWRVDYDGAAIPLAHHVAREVNEEPVETWLRSFPRGRSRNVATFGRAVRPLDDRDLEKILLLGNAPDLAPTVYPVAPEHAVPVLAARERAEVMVRSIQRDAQFRESVVRAYGGSCAVSGFSLGSTSVTRSLGILDAAHIRPVGQSGPDHVTNGLPLTPTLHRLFDAGLFTVSYDRGEAIVRTSPHLEPAMIRAPERGFELRLEDGVRLRLPTVAAHWPSPDQLAFHQRQVFRA